MADETASFVIRLELPPGYRPPTGGTAPGQAPAAPPPKSPTVAPPPKTPAAPPAGARAAEPPPAPTPSQRRSARILRPGERYIDPRSATRPETTVTAAPPSQKQPITAGPANPVRLSPEEAAAPGATPAAEAAKAPPKLTGGPEDQRAAAGAGTEGVREFAELVESGRLRRLGELIVAPFKKAAGYAEAVGAHALTGPFGAAVAAHAGEIGAALGGSQGGMGPVAAQIGLDLAQQVGPMFGPVGVAFAGAAKAAEVGLHVLEAASRQAAKNIRDYGSTAASVVGGDFLGAQQKALEKEQEEHGLKATALETMVYGVFRGTKVQGAVEDLFRRLPINSPGQHAASIGAFREVLGAIHAQQARLAPYSAQIAGGQAQARAVRIQSSVSLASQLGPELAQSAVKEAQYEAALNQALIPHVKKLLEMATKQLDSGEISAQKFTEMKETLLDANKALGLISSNSEEGKKLQAQIKEELRKIREGQQGQGAYSAENLVKQLRDGASFFRGMDPEPDLPALPGWAADGAMTPLEF